MKSDKRERKSSVWLLLACVLMGTVYLRARMSAEEEKGAAVIRGTVRSPDGTALYGITVNARGEGKNFTTTVFTGDKGTYDFPALPLGAYQVSVGTARRETIRLTASGATQDFSVELGPDLLNQTTGASWLKVIPGSEEEKKRVAQACLQCHGVWRLITRAPASPDGWARIVDRMTDHTFKALWFAANPADPLYDFYHATYGRENMTALKEYLAKNITPETKNVYAARAIVRPTGEAARAVFTEWDVPSNKPIEDQHVIGAWVDKNGIIWYSADNTNGVGRLDPRTGEIQEWAYHAPAATAKDARARTVETYLDSIGRKGDEAGMRAARLHDLKTDERGDVWATASFSNKLLRLDSRTHQFTAWNIPAKMGDYPHTSDLDQDGNYWFTLHMGADSGVGKLDPRTGKITKFDLPTKWAKTYGIASDRKGNVYFAEKHANKIGKIDRTGTLTEYTLPTPVAMPRQLRVDSKGRPWFAEWEAGQIGMLDPTTGKISEYNPGFPNLAPYFLFIDKFDKIWFNVTGGNSIGKFDPETKKFVLYLLPIPESHSRHATFDYSGESEALVYGFTSRPAIGRMYVRP